MDLQHRLFVKTVLFAVLLFVVWYNSHIGIQAQAHDGKVAHDALCEFAQGIRTDMSLNVKKKNKQIAFLVRHPNGTGGITAADIKGAIHDTQETIDTQKRRLHALQRAGLNC